MGLWPYPGAFFSDRKASRLLQSRGVTGVDIPLHDTTTTTPIQNIQKIDLRRLLK